MDNTKLLLVIIIMTLCTYLPRMIPLVFWQKKITHPFFTSFLYYLPYAILTTMIFPQIFFSTPSIGSAFAGMLIALFLAFKGKSLLVVACLSVVTVWLWENLILPLL